VQYLFDTEQVTEAAQFTLTNHQRVPVPEAAQTAFGMSANQLNDALLDHFRKGKTTLSPTTTTSRSSRPRRRRFGRSTRSMPAHLDTMLTDSSGPYALHRNDEARQMNEKTRAVLDRPNKAVFPSAFPWPGGLFASATTDAPPATALK
jgi:hypothetical protein